jgi:hypothetical protein
MERKFVFHRISVLHGKMSDMFSAIILRARVAETKLLPHVVQIVCLKRNGKIRFFIACRSQGMERKYVFHRISVLHGKMSDMFSAIILRARVAETKPLPHVVLIVCLKRNGKTVFHRMPFSFFIAKFIS